MLLYVPGAMSSPSFPAMVTTPGRSSCTNCLCDPFCRPRYQPISWICLMASRSFVGIHFYLTYRHGNAAQVVFDYAEPAGQNLQPEGGSFADAQSARPNVCSPIH